MQNNELAAAVAAGIEAARGQPDGWPYRWVFPSAFAMPVQAEGAIAVPAPPTANPPPWDIFSYTVPRGFLFVLAAAMHDFAGTAVFRQGSGDLTWSLVVNFGPSTLLVGPTLNRNVYGPSTRTVEGMNDMTFSHGSPRDGPWDVPGRPRFDPGSVLTYQIKNQNLTLAGADYTMAAIVGWLEPVGSK